MDLKTIALDSRPAVAEPKEFDRGNNNWQRGESADPDVSKSIGRVPLGRRTLWLPDGSE